MNAYEILRYVHRIGHPLSGTVTEYSELWPEELFGDHIYVKTANIPAILSHSGYPGEDSPFSSTSLPPTGTKLNAVVLNCVDNVLYLSMKPRDLEPATIQAWRDWYAFLDTLNLGGIVMGTVAKVRRFGIFVDIGLPYVGLIDIGHTSFNQGVQFPRDYDVWPQVGDPIRCRVSYVRLHGRQIGLGWLP